VAAHNRGGFTLQVDLCVCARTCMRVRACEMSLKWLKVVTVLQQCTIIEQHAVVCFVWP